METQLAIRHELHEIYRSRSRVGIIPHILFMLASLYFQRQGLLQGNFWVLVLFIVCLGSICRALVIGKLYKKWSQGIKWVRYFNVFSFFLLGAGWGLHFWDVHSTFGASTPNVAYTLLLLVGFITSSSTTLIGDRYAYYTFITTMILIVIGTYLTDTDQSFFYVIFYILIYFFFSVSNFRVGHGQLYSVLEAKVRSKKEQERLENIINAVPGYVTLIDKNLICYMANSLTLKLYPNIVGLKFQDINSDSIGTKLVLEFMNSSKTSKTVEYQTVIHGDNYSFLASLKRTPEGGAIIVSTETTELMEARKTIREQEAKAHYTAKLVSLGEMAAGIAHEVNNPLTIIQGSARIIHRLVDVEPVDLGSIKLLTSKMVDTCDRISKTVRSLKSLSRNGENDPMERVTVDEIIGKCLDVCGQRFRRHEVELIMPDPNDFVVMGREVQLGQVLVNLLGNSIDAVKEMEKPWVKIELEQSGHDLNIFISDSGHGIPQELRDKIMEPFFTTKEVNQGTGLGLSISKQIMKDHNGELNLVPDSPHTKFKMRIPLA